MILSKSEVIDELRKTMSEPAERAAKGRHLAEIIRKSGEYRWAAIYDVDMTAGDVSLAAFSGPRAPAYPSFAITQGLTGDAIRTRKTVNAGNVMEDPRYLTSFGSTQSEIIVPVVSLKSGNVIGTIDVESDRLHAFPEEEQKLLEECAEVIREFWE